MYIRFISLYILPFKNRIPIDRVHHRQWKGSVAQDNYTLKIDKE